MPAVPAAATATSPKAAPIRVDPSSYAPILAPAPPSGVVTLPEARLEEFRVEPPRPALLAGEYAREYQRGGASWYGPGFHGRRTANGERYDMHAMTAAHRTLPFGTWVRVHSLVNGREVDVRITDRGPFIRSRVIDVSRGAAEALGMLGLGFKEVVLLVPESTSVGVDLPLPKVKSRRVVRRGSTAR